MMYTWKEIVREKDEDREGSAYKGVSQYKTYNLVITV